MCFLLILSSLLLYKEVCSCGYDSCTQTKVDVLNVHIVPHTHNDVGWIKTFDQYYNDEVRQILNSVVEELWKDRNRRFMYVETAFFLRWWGEQNKRVKYQVHILVNEGRLKFIGGAWTMNDEATTHYQSIIDQFTLGLRKLKDTFGSCGVPQVAWQIDPFGHSQEFASLLAAMGYDGVFLCRIDSEDINYRRANKTMEFIWRADHNSGRSSDIFTGVLYDHYTPPRGLNLQSIREDIKEKISDFYDYIKLLSETYTTNNILIPMGDDFAYTDAYNWFGKLDVLIKLINMRAEKESLKVKVFYSTPDCYLKAVKIDNPALSIKTDDFFPYGNENGYWTGYYTSRPSLKFLEREANRYLQVIKQLYVIADLNIDSAIIDELRSAMGIMQHHDAITGTEKQHVAEDYTKMVSRAVENSLLVINKVFTKSAGSHSNEFLLKFEKCKLNESECSTTEESRNFITTIYNPLAWEVFDVDVVIPVKEGKFSVYDSKGKRVDAKLVPIPEWYNTQIPTRRSNATYELIFKADRVGPLGFESFYIEKLLCNVKIIKAEELDIVNGPSMDITIESGYYQSSTQSGAYVFSPRTNEPVLWNNFTLSDITTIDNWYNVTPIIKQFKKKGNMYVIKITWLCDSISVEDGVGKEVVVRYNTDILNRGIFYTDSNGRQMIRRVFEGKQTSVAKNYYPVSNRISISDNRTRFTVITDRAEGGYSPNNGTVELMINRRLLFDDGLGVDEALDNNVTVNVINHFLVITDPSDKHSIDDEQRLNIEVNMAPVILFSDATNLPFRNWYKMKKYHEGLERNFPEGIHLLTLEPYRRKKLLLRLENYLDPSECIFNTKEIDLCNIFSTFTIVSLRETTLAANKWLAKNKRWIWKKKEPDFVESVDDVCRIILETEKHRRITNGDKCSSIKIYPKEIRTFIVDYKMKYSFAG